MLSTSRLPPLACGVRTWILALARRSLQTSHMPPDRRATMAATRRGTYRAARPSVGAALRSGSGRRRGSLRSSQCTTRRRNVSPSVMRLVLPRDISKLRAVEAVLRALRHKEPHGKGRGTLARPLDRPFGLVSQCSGVGRGGASDPLGSLPCVQLHGRIQEDPADRHHRFGGDGPLLHFPLELRRRRQRATKRQQSLCLIRAESNRGSPAVDRRESQADVATARLDGGQRVRRLHLGVADLAKRLSGGVFRAGSCKHMARSLVGSYSHVRYLLT